jgi:pimeloyl-ACP methyl ester carboxylesterase
MRIYIFLFIICCTPGRMKGQEVVYFFSSDSSKIRGDLYLRDSNDPFIILCHSEAADRSEFSDIAPRLLNLNYNCLAVDMGTSGSHNLSFSNAQISLHAAIAYVRHLNTRPVILLGSSWSASLCLIEASSNSRIRGIVALSPGEYFQPRILMSEVVKKISQPVFICGTQAEFSYLRKMVEERTSEGLTLFQPEKGKGVHGAAALRGNDITRDEYWFALMMFFKKLV